MSPFDKNNPFLQHLMQRQMQGGSMPQPQPPQMGGHMGGQPMQGGMNNAPPMQGGPGPKPATPDFEMKGPKTPWMDRKGMFGIDRQAGLMGGLGLLAGGYY